MGTERLKENILVNLAKTGRGFKSLLGRLCHTANLLINVGGVYYIFDIFEGVL